MAAGRKESEMKIYHKNSATIPAGAISIGRGSAFGNPFEIPSDGDRDEVIEKFRLWIHTQPKLIERVKLELRGLDLVCHCSPQACHGNILMTIANDEIYVPVEAKPKKRKQQGLFL